MTTAIHEVQTQLTLREGYERYYDTSELSEASITAFRSALSSWERHSSNPPIGEIDNATVHDWKQSLQADPKVKSNRTIATHWRALRSIFRRLAEPRYGNPHGLSIIADVPYLKLPRVVSKPPKKLSFEQLDALYLAAPKMRRPVVDGIPAGWWWRCFVVLGYFCGFRKADALKVHIDDIDLEHQTLNMSAQKTGKTDRFHLHEVVVEHCRQIWFPRELLLPFPNVRRSAFYDQWGALLQKAGISDPDVHPHALRRTAASEAERVRPGAGAMLLQHARRDVTGQSYLDLCDILRDVINEMRVPDTFKHGVRLTEAAEQRDRKKLLHVRNFAAPAKPDATLFEFADDSFAYRNVWYTMRGGQLVILKALALSPDPVDVETLVEAYFADHSDPPDDFEKRGANVCSGISTLRRRLRRILFVGEDFDPCPCTERGDGGKWTLFFPSPLGEKVGVITPYDLSVSRERAGLSGRKLAELMGVSESTVYLWESGQSRIGSKHQAALQGILGRYLGTKPRSDREQQAMIRRKKHSEDPHCTYCRRQIRYQDATLDKAADGPEENGGPKFVLICRSCKRRKAKMKPADLLAWAQRIVELSRADGSDGTQAN